MAISKRNPTAICVFGDCSHPVNDLAAGEAITPGHLVEMYDDGGVNKWRKHATSTEQVTLAVAMEQGEMNKGVDDTCAAGDLAKVWFLKPGDVFWGLIPSGQTIANAAKLQSNGGGTLKAATATTAAANVARFQSLDNLGAVTTLTRCRIQVIC